MRRTTARDWDRVAAGMGIASVALSALGTFLVGTPPPADASMSRIRAYYAVHHTALIWQMLLLGLGAVALIAFAGGLHGYLRRHERSSDQLSLAAFGSAAAVALMVLVGLFLEIGLIYRVAPAADDNLLRALFDALTTGAVFFAFPIALFVGAVTLEIRRTGATSSGILYLGIATVLANLAAPSQLFVNSGPWTPGGSSTFIPFGFLAVWEVAVAATMISRSRRTPERA